MNPLTLLQHATTYRRDADHIKAGDKPGLMQILLFYVMPLSLIPPLVLYFVVQHHSKLFMDILPGNRLIIVGFFLYLLQIVMVAFMALATKHLAAMVDARPTYESAFLVIAVATTPFWGVSLFYLVPSFTVNILLHGVAALASTILIYIGVQRVFGLQKQGAVIMLTVAVLSTAAVGFALVLIPTLMFWTGVQGAQFGVS